jgi:hypothetical protein
MMKDRKMDYRTTDIQNGVVHKIREHNFLLHELAMRNQNGCSNLGYRN